MKEVIERCNWLVNKCEDKAITPDVKDDVRYLLEEIERLNKENKLLKSNPNFVYAMRNNKAIEYLERKQKETEWWDTDFMQCINILKGENNENDNTSNRTNN